MTDFERRQKRYGVAPGDPIVNFEGIRAFGSVYLGGNAFAKRAPSGEVQVAIFPLHDKSLKLTPAQQKVLNEWKAGLEN